MKYLVMLLAALTVAGCGTKVVVTRTPGAESVKPHMGMVCVMDRALPFEIPVGRVAQLNLRKGGEIPGDIWDFVAAEARKVGGNQFQVMAYKPTGAWGYVGWIDPKLKFNCAAAGGQLR